MTAYMDHKDLANEVIEQSRAREITDGVHRVLDRIAEAESVAGREAGSVHLLAATKTRDVGEILAAIDAGVHRIGENRPQEITSKRRDWPGCWPNVGILGVLRPRGVPRPMLPTTFPSISSANCRLTKSVKCCR